MNRKPPSECTYTCDNSTLLTGECGGESAYNVYMTGRNIVTRKRCLAKKDSQSLKITVLVSNEVIILRQMNTCLHCSAMKQK